MGSWDMDFVIGIVCWCLCYDQIFGYDMFQDEWSVDIFIVYVDLVQCDYVELVFVVVLEFGLFDIECLIMGVDGNE